MPCASDGVRASIHAADGIDGRALQLDFDLAGTAGYAIADRALPLDLPANYEISFYVRADAPVNNFQFKLTDASGDNVWWFNRPNFDFPQRVASRSGFSKRQIEFAWGPTTDRTLRHAAATRVRRRCGTRRRRRVGPVQPSSRCANFRRCPTIWPTPAVRASSDRPGADPAFAVDGQLATAVAAAIRRRAGAKSHARFRAAGANSAASSCIGWTMNSRRATTVQVFG